MPYASLILSESPAGAAAGAAGALGPSVCMWAIHWSNSDGVTDRM